MKPLNTYLIGPDDMPTCPKHGIRLITDYFPAEGEEPEHEIGHCPLCKTHYRFEMGDE